MWQTWYWVKDYALEKQSVNSRTQLQLYITHLQGELAKYEFLPELIATNKRLVELLLTPGDPERVDALNRYLEIVNKIANASDTYLMDSDGLTIAASNWQSPRPFIGRNFSYRPYFRKAMKGELGRYFALGTTSKRRGYYFAYPVRNQGSIVGAVVIKMDITGIEEQWQEREEEVVVTDPDGVVFITTVPSWRFHALNRIDSETISRVIESKRYPETQLDKPPLFSRFEPVTDLLNQVVIERKNYLHIQQAMQEAGWNVHLLTPKKSLNQQLFQVQGIATLVFIALVLLGLYLRQRQKRIDERNRFEIESRDQLRKAHDQLEQRVYERTQALLYEVEERKHAEEELRHAQDELIQAAKLAVLGELSTGISHEMNQPLAAIRSYADNARLLIQHGREADAESNLRQIADLTDRMAQISSQLKLFARKTDGELTRVSLKDAIDASSSILKPQFKKSHTRLRLDNCDEIYLLANRVQLEQVLVNLFGNAMNAMSEIASPQIAVSVETVNSKVAITVKDNGPGIATEHLQSIFDPFFTTREKGLGLGLSISHRIMSSMGGELDAGNHKQGGAMFTLILPLFESSEK